MSDDELKPLTMVEEAEDVNVDSASPVPPPSTSKGSISPSLSAEPSTAMTYQTSILVEKEILDDTDSSVPLSTDSPPGDLDQGESCLSSLRVVEKILALASRLVCLCGL